MNKKLTFQMQFKEVSVAADKIKIKGFASTPQVDRYDDIVQPIAFQNSMESYMKNPVVLLGHNSDKPLWIVTEYTISPQGLEVTAELTNDIENTFKNIQDGILRGFSIGFICKNWAEKVENDRYIREITELDLVEISVVSTPANPSSLFTLAKSLKNFFSEIEKKSAEDEEKVEIETNQEEEKATKQHCKSCDGEDCPWCMPGEEEDAVHCKGCKGEDCKWCGGKPKPKKEAETEGKEAETETPEEKTPEAEGDQKENQTTGEEAPAGEETATPKKVEDPATDKTEDVKGDQKPPEVPTTIIIDEAQMDELKALIKATVEAKIAEIEAKHQIVVGDLQKIIEDGKKSYDALLKWYRELEDDILNIEIKRPGSITRKTAGFDTKNVMTYDQLFGLQTK